MYFRSSYRWGLSVLLAALLGLGLAQDSSTNTVADLQAMEQNQDIWALPGKDFAGTRYSELNQITTENVSDLDVAWTFSTGVLRGHEGTPLVIDNVMYLVTPFPNIVYAIDLNDPNVLKWEFTPDTDPASIGVACCDVVNRGVFYADGKIFFNALDGMVYALDAESGEVVWQVQNADPSNGETMTNHPIVINDKVIVGVSGGEFGIRGFITAYDINSGEQVWRFHNTGPDDEVGITDRFQPFYDHLKGEDLGVSTWTENQWQQGGSSVWGWFTYDPELNLLYFGTSNPGTWNPSLRRANADSIGEDQVAYSNLWSASIMARDPDTGELVWAYQLTPHDEWDYDGINENILTDLEINGETRKVLVHFDRNGFGYTIDRETGEVLVAEPFGEGVNWAESINLETGLPVRNAEFGTHQGEITEGICPSAMGYKDQQPASYSPKTGLFYVPTNHLCMDYGGTEVEYISGVPYVGATVKSYPGPGGYGGALIAWDATTGEIKWQIEEQFAAWGGTLVTESNVVFYGTLDGWFKAVDADSGEVLWQFQTGSGIIGAPSTFTGPDGRQYVAILSGVGGWSGLTVAGDLSLDDPTAALGAVNAFADLGRYTQKGGTLFVFALDEQMAESGN